VLRWNCRSAGGEVDGHLCIDDERCHPSTFAWPRCTMEGVRLQLAAEVDRAILATVTM
jgi:hypothetical protein